jgi:uncharacterized membrane protein (UPF0127 family)
MKLYNKTKQTIISHNLILAKSVKQQIVGLLQSKKSTSMLFHTRFGIHTFGMKYPIDVLVLDSTNHVVKIQHNLFPNRLFFWHPKFPSLIELPKGTIKRAKTTLSDEVEVC